MSTLIILGTGLPDGNVTPEFIGQYFINTVPSAYIAVGLTDGDWVDVTDGGGAGAGGIPVQINTNPNSLVATILPAAIGQILIKSEGVYISRGTSVGQWDSLTSHVAKVPTSFSTSTNASLDKWFSIFGHATHHLVVSGNGALARNLAIILRAQNQPTNSETIQGKLIITLEGPGDATDFTVNLSHTTSFTTIPGTEPIAHIEPVTNTTSNGTFNISGQNKMFIYDIIYPNSIAGFPLGSALMFIKQAEIDMSVITVNT